MENGYLKPGVDEFKKSQETGRTYFLLRDGDFLGLVERTELFVNSLGEQDAVGVSWEGPFSSFNFDPPFKTRVYVPEITPQFMPIMTRLQQASK